MYRFLLRYSYCTFWQGVLFSTGRIWKPNSGCGAALSPRPKLYTQKLASHKFILSVKDEGSSYSDVIQQFCRSKDLTSKVFKIYQVSLSNWTLCQLAGGWSQSSHFQYSEIDYVLISQILPSYRHVLSVGICQLNDTENQIGIPQWVCHLFFD